ncbi:hypothetical protein F5Y03DRAFT_369964 [Xylaria venustula]|nr:hypothetical protein F5Y03DRAFT_369964 [Xylaria venustula]
MAPSLFPASLLFLPISNLAVAFLPSKSDDLALGRLDIFLSSVFIHRILLLLPLHVVAFSSSVASLLVKRC